MKNKQKFVIAIEETVVQEFNIIANTAEEAMEIANTITLPLSFNITFSGTVYTLFFHNKFS